MNTELNKLMNQVKTIKEQRDFYRTRCIELINEQNIVPKKKYDEVKNELNYLKVAFNKLKSYCEELEEERKELITKHDKMAYDHNKFAEEHMQTLWDLKKAEERADALYLANRILIETDFSQEDDKNLKCNLNGVYGKECVRFIDTDSCYENAMNSINPYQE